VQDNPQFTWGIARRQQKGPWRFVKEDRYKQLLRARILQRVNPRTAFLLKVEYIFGKALLQEDIDTNMMQQSLAAVYEQCVGRFWGLPNNGETIYSKVQPREPVPT